MKKIAIIDYGLGNLRSVIRGLEKAGANAVITCDAGEIASADGLVLPGVGAFHEGMDQLGPLQGTVVEAARQVPLLGICLGMQMLLETSEEHGIHKGLGLIPGNVKRFPRGSGQKVPHMGWNSLTIEKTDNPLFAGFRQDEYVYFVHSYYADTATGVHAHDHAVYLPVCLIGWQRECLRGPVPPGEERCDGPAAAE